MAAPSGPIASAGEALIDRVEERDGADRVLRVRPGGSPFNVAIGLARLGHRAAYAGRLSTDAFGRLLAARLVDEGVDRSFVQQGPEPTAQAIVGEASGEATYAFRWHGTADRSFDPGAFPDAAFESLAALHLGSVALGIDPVGARLLRLMERLHGRVFLSFDPNVRQDVVDDWPTYRTRVRRAFELADLVQCSEADLGAFDPDPSAERVLGRLERLGPTVVTRGALGSSLIRPGRPSLHETGLAITVRDTVGAGDASMAALLHALATRDRLRSGRLAGLGGDEWRAILRIANTAGAMTCERLGADPPTATELRVRLGSH